MVDLVGYLVGRGCSRNEPCREARIDAAILEAPDDRVPGSVMERLWQVGERLTGDPDLGLRSAEAHNPGALSILGYVVLNCPTARDVLERLGRFIALLNDGLRVDLQREGEFTFCRFEAVASLDNYVLRSPRQVMEAMSAGVIRSMAMLSDVPIVPTEVVFRHSKPASIVEHARVLGANVRFSGATDQLAFRTVDLDRGVRSANPALLVVFERHAEAMLAQLSEYGPVSRRLLHALAAHLKGGVPTLSQLARALAMSTRHLQRTLKEEGTTFQALLDQARRELALRHLATPEGSAAEVAFLLGFSDASAFTRAFRRWTGATPGAWRASQRGR